MELRDVHRNDDYRMCTLFKDISSASSFVNYFSGVAVCCTFGVAYVLWRNKWIKRMTHYKRRHDLRKTIMVALLEQFSHSEILDIFGSLNKQNDQLRIKLFERMVELDNSLEHKKVVFCVLLNELLKLQRVIPIDPQQFLEFRRKCDPSLKDVTCDTQPIQIAQILVEMFRLCKDAIKRSLDDHQSTSSSDDVSDISAEGYRQRMPLCNSCNSCDKCRAHCRKTQDDLEICTVLVSYTSYLMFCEQPLT